MSKENKSGNIKVENRKDFVLKRVIVKSRAFLFVHLKIP